MPDIPAKAVTVVKGWHAWCTLCDWSGDWEDNYRVANEARQEHLEEHRKAYACGIAAATYQASMHRQPLTVAAVSEEQAEAVGELADAAQAMAVDEHGTLRPVTDFTEHPEPGRPHKWWCDGDDGGDAAGPHVHCWDHVHAVDLLTGKSTENGGRGVADAATEAGRGDG